MDEPAINVVAHSVKSIRTALGWTQRRLAAAAGVSQALVWAVEHRRVEHLTLDTIERLLGAMGARLRLGIDAPFLSGGPGQRDAAHIRTLTYVATRLRRVGWQVLTEVEIGGGRSRGWIDIVAFHPATGLMLVIEIKTEIHDVGQIERRLGWYQREARSVAEREGWHVSRTVGVLVLLMTVANDERVKQNRDAFALGYPLRAAVVQALVDGDAAAGDARRGVAMVDPYSRRERWIRPLEIDGRRTAARYSNYAGFMRIVAQRSRRR